MILGVAPLRYFWIFVKRAHNSTKTSSDELGMMITSYRVSHGFHLEAVSPHYAKKKKNIKFSIRSYYYKRNRVKKKIYPKFYC